jgi:hypothetical protein
VGCEGDEEVLAKAQGDKPTAMKRLHTYIRTQQVSQAQTTCVNVVERGEAVFGLS